MKKVIAAGLATAALAPLAAPAVASASVWSVQSTIARQFARTVRNRAGLSGIHVVSTSVKCRPDGGGTYSCLGTVTGRVGGTYVRYGIYINATNYSWHTVGSAFRL